MAMRRAGVDVSRRLRSAGAAAPSMQQAATFDQTSVVGSFEPQGARHASMQAVKMRMKSVENISKITKAMKMVAASRLRGVQEKTEASRGFPFPMIRILGDFPAAAVDNCALVPVTSDKGLCGGINSGISKVSKVFVEFGPSFNQNQSIFILGEKGRSQLIRGDTAKLVSGFAVDATKAGITFAQCSEIADKIQTSGEGFDKVQVLYNKFINAASFRPTVATVLTPEQREKHVEDMESLFNDYELEGPVKTELMQDLFEFQLGSILYHGMLENSCSELGSRMQAMENSTKNAGEMLDKLTLFYNRTRQAKITTELIEIISGAEALAQMTE